MEERKALPVGIENFYEIINSGYYYVDKTALIKDILSDKAKVTLFTRPRRFGKSLNMSMLKSFFEVGADFNIFDGLAIYGERQLVDEHMGKYPVISISLKSIEGSSFKDAFSMCSQIIEAEAMRHMYLIESRNLNSIEKKKYEKLLTDDYSESFLKNSLWLLSTLLSKNYEKKKLSYSLMNMTFLSIKHIKTATTIRWLDSSEISLKEHSRQTITCSLQSSQGASRFRRRAYSQVSTI